MALFSSSVFAQRLPPESRPCALGSHCVQYSGILNNVFSRGGGVLNAVGVTRQRFPGSIYHQRAIGRNCAEATTNARNRLLFNYPELECSGANGIYCGASNRGPELVGGSCMRSRQGEVVAWLVCDNNNPRLPRPATPEQILGGYILMETLRNSQRRNGR
jgi:hypothetical protein